MHEEEAGPASTPTQKTLRKKKCASSSKECRLGSSRGALPAPNDRPRFASFFFKRRFSRPDRVADSLTIDVCFADRHGPHFIDWARIGPARDSRLNGISSDSKNCRLARRAAAERDEFVSRGARGFAGMAVGAYHQRLLHTQLRLRVAQKTHTASVLRTFGWGGAPPTQKTAATWGRHGARATARSAATTCVRASVTSRKKLPIYFSRFVRATKRFLSASWALPKSFSHIDASASS